MYANRIPGLGAWQEGSNTLGCDRLVRLHPRVLEGGHFFPREEVAVGVVDDHR